MKICIVQYGLSYTAFYLDMPHLVVESNSITDAIAKLVAQRVSYETKMSEIAVDNLLTELHIDKEK